jgi:hypothetical protein
MGTGVQRRIVRRLILTFVAGMEVVHQCWLTHACAKLGCFDGVGDDAVASFRVGCHGDVRLKVSGTVQQSKRPVA